MRTYICAKCGVEYENSKYSKYCPNCRSNKRQNLSEEKLKNLRQKEKERFRNRRRKLKRIALDYKGGKCQICGYDKCNRALEFHHVNPSEKDFSIGVKGYSMPLLEMKKELDKCILVCSNCHAEIHDGSLDISDISLEPVNKNAFNEVLEKK